MKTTQTQRNVRALRLSYFTVAYNVLEGVASLAAGAVAGSVALGFWHIDPLIGLLIAGYLFKEGREAMKEGTVCSC